jgi:O-antigen ligase
MNRDVLDRWCEWGILGLALATLLLMPLAFGGQPQPAIGCSLDFLIRNPFAMAQCLMVPLLALWAIRLWISPKPRLFWPPICWAVLAFVVYAIVRYRHADIEYIARQEALHILVYAFLFFALLNNLHRQQSVQAISYSLIFLGMAISGYAIYQFLSGSIYTWFLFKTYQHRGSGTYINPNHLGGLLDMLVPLGLAYTLVSRAKPVTKVFLAYASLVMLVGIGVTVSRGSWAATGVALLIFFMVLLFHRSYRLPAFMLLTVVVVGLLFLWPKSFFVQARLRAVMTQEGRVNDDARFAVWEPAVRVWQDDPWWGVGPAQFDFRFRAHRPESLQLRPERVHNDYLNTLVDYGVAGAALVLAAWVLLAVGLAKTWRAVRGSRNDFAPVKGSNKFAFVLGASIGLLAFMAHAFVDFNWYIAANALVAVALMALLSSHLRYATESGWVGLRVSAKVPVSLVLIAGLVCLAQAASHDAAEQRWLALAQRAPSFSTAEIDALIRAFDVEPKNPETARAIAEALQHRSQEGGESYADEDTNYRRLAKEAMGWFGRAMKLNPWDSRAYAGYGWCLDWLGRSAESGPYFTRAEDVDPNSYALVNDIGRHYVELGDYAAATPWFERSLHLKVQDNPVAWSYLAIARERLMEAATNDISARLMRPLTVQ